MTRVALIFGGPEVATTGELFYRAFEPIARSSLVEPVAIRIDKAADVDPAIDAFAAQPNVGLVAAAEPGAVVNRVSIINAAGRHRLPAVILVLGEQPLVGVARRPTASAWLTSTAAPHHMSIASCAAQIRPIYRCRRRINSS